LENPALPKSNWKEYFDAARTNASPSMITTKPGKSAFAALRQLVVFQVTYPGAPMIYYGAEVGMWGANDPDNRQPMLWGDIAYEPERRDHRGAVSVSRRAPDEELRAFYRHALALRAAHAVFRRGDFKWLRTGQDRLLAYERCYQGDRVVVILNASDVELTYRLKVSGRDLWNAGAAVSCGSLAIPPRGWRILRL
jgi:glycosidase